MRRNFIKKLLIGGLLTTLCLCLTFVVNATKLEDYTPITGEQTLELKTWDDINQPNDLLGVTLLFNDIIYPVGLKNDYDEQSAIEISYNFNFEEYELRSRAYIWGCGTDGVQIQHEIPRGMILRIQEEHSGDDPLSIFTETYRYGTNDGLLFNLYDPDYEYNLTNVSWYSYWTYGPRLISFPYDERDPEEVQLELNVIGSNWDSRFPTAWTALYAFLKRNTTIVYSSTMAGSLTSLDQTLAYYEGYDDGYEVGYTRGYEEGTISGGDNNYRFTFLTGIFNGVSDLLGIEIFPNVKLGYFVFVPLALGITGMIFWFWRKD